jgi:hypothetical protein
MRHLGSPPLRRRVTTRGKLNVPTEFNVHVCHQSALLCSSLQVGSWCACAGVCPSPVLHP